LRVRFLADANFNQKIIAGLLLREAQIDFELPQNVIPERMQDTQVLELGAKLGRVIVTHDVRTMPGWFRNFIEDHVCPGLILVPDRMTIREAIEDLLLIWHLSEAQEWINQMRRLPL